MLTMHSVHTNSIKLTLQNGSPRGQVGNSTHFHWHGQLRNASGFVLEHWMMRATKRSHQ